MTTKNNEKTIKAIQFLSNTDVDFFNLIDFEQILFNAVLKNNIKAIEYLLDNDVDIHAQNDRALLLACCNSKLEVVKYLVERGADIYADECGAFRWAANHGVAESVKYLIELGIDIHAQDDFAFTNAFYGGDVETVKVLLEHGAKFDCLDNSPLQIALGNRNKDLLQYIILDCNISIDGNDIDYIEQLYCNAKDNEDDDLADTCFLTLNLIKNRDLHKSIKNIVQPNNKKERKMKI